LTQAAQRKSTCTHALQMGNAPCSRHAENVATASTANNSSNQEPQKDLCTFSCRCTRASEGIDALEASDEPMTIEIEQDNLPLAFNALTRPGPTSQIALAARSRARAMTRQMQTFREIQEEQMVAKTNNRLHFAQSYHAASGGPLADNPVSRQLQPLLELAQLYSVEAARNRRSMASSPLVVLNIYDIGTSSVGQALNSVLRHFGTGAFHCGVDIYGCEWSFSDTEDGNGMGVFCSRPRRCEGHSYCESVKMGTTSMTQSEVLKLIQLMSSYWPVADYDTLTKNCCHFCDELCQRLRVGPIPSWVMNLAGAGAALAATGDATCCREVAREVVGPSAVDKICCVAPGLGGDVILYHL